jgi:hypothetical protein
MKTARWLAAKVGNGIDPKFFNQVAQFAHFGMMFTVTTVVANVLTRLGHDRIGLVVGFVMCLVYASWHEFLWDPTHENAATRGSDLEDFVFLVAGSFSGLLAFWIR